MSIKITSGQVNNGFRVFVKGDTMTGLSEEEEARLISLGFAEKSEEGVEHIADDDLPDDDFPEDDILEEETLEEETPEEETPEEETPEDVILESTIPEDNGYQAETNIADAADNPEVLEHTEKTVGLGSNELDITQESLQLNVEEYVNAGNEQQETAKSRKRKT